ncbi:MAG TPA: hypothetical protein VFA18_20585 [Gemmataceae bacterium]|nr:hypothetical protein [Gemmataceae bacterium]
MEQPLPSLSALAEAPAARVKTAIADRTGSARLVSLDQFRGYTVLGMFFVNFVGGFAVIQDVFKHHVTYFSYADSIMPQFFFAVGFAYRLTLLRRLETVGARAAYGHAVRRNLGLLLVAFMIHHLDGRYERWADLRDLGFWGFMTTSFQREFFQTLTHIALASFWIMPVVAASARIRIAFACLSGGLFVVLSQLFYYDWVMHRPGIDGGPLGFLTWTIPMIVGTLAYDAVAPMLTPVPQRRWRIAIGRMLAWSAILMLLGYGLACLNRVTSPNAALSAETGTPAGMTSVFVEPPFVPPSLPVNLWTMSQRAGSISSFTFGAGLSLAVFALFALACEVGGLRLGIFTTLGSNALAAYIIHELLMHAIKPLTPHDSPMAYVLAAVALFVALCYLFIRHLEKHKLFLKL